MKNAVFTIVSFILAPSLIAAPPQFQNFPDGNKEVLSDVSEIPVSPKVLAPSSRLSSSALSIRYDDTYQTARYKCWGSTGLSDQWQGITAENIRNAGVVRRGRTFYVTSDTGSLTPSDITILSPAPPSYSRQELTTWTVTSHGNDVAITIPDNAPIGDYQIYSGEDFCTAYVIFDIYDHDEELNERQLASWGYEDTPNDTIQNDYLNTVVYGPGPSSDWDSESSRLYMFVGGDASSDEGVFGQRLVELAVSIHGWGARDEFEAGRNLYTIVGQRMVWTSSGSFTGLNNGYLNTFDRVFNGEGIQIGEETFTASELTTEIAEKAALGHGRINHLPEEYIIDRGQCMNFASTTVSLARAAGIAARPSYTIGTTGWAASFHVWAELLVGETNFDFPGWDTPWWKYDPADQRRVETITHLESSITPPRMDGWSDFVHNVKNLEDCTLQGGQYFGAYDRNISLCDQPANHTSVILKPDASVPPALPNTLIWNNFRQFNCPWTVTDLWSTINGTSTAPGGIDTEANGYALNLLMNLTDSGPALINNAETNDDLPILIPGNETPGIIGGLGTNFYLIDISDNQPIQIEITKGAYDHGTGIRLYASIDETPHVRELTPVGTYSSVNGILQIPSIPEGSRYLHLMVVGEDESELRFGNQVSFEYALLLSKSTTPTLNDLFPPHGRVVSGIVPISATLQAEEATLCIDGKEVAQFEALDDNTLSIIYNWDTNNLRPWQVHRITISTESETFFADYTVREPEILFYEGFETANSNPWTFNKTQNDTSGEWTIASPREMTASTPPFDQTSPGAPTEGLQCLYTGRHPDGEASTGDVDNGSVIAQLDNIPIPVGLDVTMTYDLWWYQRDLGEDNEDSFLCQISTDDGVTWTTVTARGTNDPSHDWQEIQINLSPYLSATENLSIRFTATDGPQIGNLLEVAIDQLQITGHRVSNEGVIIY